jgi:hypothetical protein
MDYKRADFVCCYKNVYEVLDKSVSFIKVDFPLPETPVTHTKHPSEF